MSPRAAAFAREVIARAEPEGKERAKNLLWAAGKLADYAIGLGLETAPDVVLHPSTAERSTRCAPGLSGVSRRTLRTNLRFIGRRAVPLRAAGLACLGAGAGLICGGTDPGRRNLTSALITALDGGTGLPRLDTSRLRATWLADCAGLLGLAHVHACGRDQLLPAARRPGRRPGARRRG